MPLPLLNEAALAQLIADAVRDATGPRPVNAVITDDPTLAAEYLTVQQVSQVTGFTRRSLESMRARRLGPHYIKVGNSVRYRIADVRNWMESEGARNERP